MIESSRRLISRAAPPLASALKETLREGYSKAQFGRDALAGISVGIIAVPLSLALAIDTGVAPEYGLYTAIVGGLVIALLGGSRVSVSGPTAAFIAVLVPIVAVHGFGGLLVAGVMAGLILMAMGWARMGKFISFIPHPVTTGFTAGIAVLIASRQLSDLLGLTMAAKPPHFVGYMLEVVKALDTLQWPELAVGLATLLVLCLWPRLKLPVPAYLGGAVFAGGVAWLLHHFYPSLPLVTIADRFHFVLADGSAGRGIPPVLPQLHWPWNLPGADGKPLLLSYALFRDLVGPAFTIAMLGAIESLLCAVIADGMTGKKHDPDAELFAHGIGNVIAPLLGGIPATGALARTAANVKAGARSPIASAIHALFVLAAILTLAPVLSWLPLTAKAALLLLVAWNMSERHKFNRILRVAPRADVLLMLMCFLLTVFFDMTLAITVGVVLASLQFMHRMSKLSEVRLVAEDAPDAPKGLPPHVRYYQLAGPLFFGAAERAMTAIVRGDRKIKAIIIDLAAVPTIDASGLVALEGAIDDLNAAGVFVALCSAQRSVLGVLRDAGYHKLGGQLGYYSSVQAALKRAAWDQPPSNL